MQQQSEVRRERGASVNFHTQKCNYLVTSYTLMQCEVLKAKPQSVMVFATFSSEHHGVHCDLGSGFRKEL
jgi:hypothetical protein